jgi:acetoacetyl-CoA synthetase
MWNWLITGLASGACLLLYDGSPFYPDPEILWRFTSKHKCKLFGTAAKYIDALNKNSVFPGEKFDLESLKTITSTGSPLVHEGFDYVYSHIKSDVHLASISGGTDIISCFVLGTPTVPVYRGEIQCAGLGMDVDVYDDNGESKISGAGELVCKSPFPSMPIKFWNDDDGSKYKEAYFDKFDNIWCHGDWVEKTMNHGFIIHGRSDATLNPGGVRIGTAEIYRQVEQIPEVLESIAIGQEWEGDVRVVLFVKLKEGTQLDDSLTTLIKSKIRSGASPRHVPAKILPVDDIPRTKSNKITELAVRNIVHGRPVNNTEALANPESLEFFKNREELKS